MHTLTERAITFGGPQSEHAFLSAFTVEIETALARGPVM